MCTPLKNGCLYIKLCSLANFLVNKVPDPDVLWYLVEAAGADISFPKGQHCLAFLSLAKTIHLIVDKKDKWAASDKENREPSTTNAKMGEDQGPK